MPLVDEGANEGWRPCDDRVTAFAWAREMGAGTGLLAYRTAWDEVVIVSVEYTHREEGCIWAVEEVGRFRAAGPHGGASVSMRVAAGCEEGE
jgi:hypothetical protein